MRQNYFNRHSKASKVGTEEGAGKDGEKDEVGATTSSDVDCKEMTTIPKNSSSDILEINDKTMVNLALSEVPILEQPPTLRKSLYLPIAPFPDSALPY